MDVKISFLNGMVEEEVYIEKLKGFETFDRETHVCRLRRALYGIQQVPRACYTQIGTYHNGLGFTTIEADPNIYYIVLDGKFLILVLYVDDLILTRVENLIQSCKEDLGIEFEMKDVGLIHCFLGLWVWQGDGELFVGQGKYTSKIIHIFHMQKLKPMDTPLSTHWRNGDASTRQEGDATIYKQLVGSLMYLVNTILNICYVGNQLNQFMVKPTKIHQKIVKHVLIYLRGTPNFGLWYSRIDGVTLQEFTDVDSTGSSSNRKSTLGAIFSVASTIISQYSRKRIFVALNSTEVEYMVASQATCKAIWMREHLIGILSQEMYPTIIHYGNQCFIKIFENSLFHDRSKHIDIRYHHFRDCVQMRIMILQYIPIEEKDADIFTKELSNDKFEFKRSRIGVLQNTFLAKREC